MATSSVTKQWNTPILQDHVGSDSKSRIEAVFLSPDCAHDWVRLDDDLQTLESEGKIIWRCQGCAEITNTYDWQTP